MPKVASWIRPKDAEYFRRAFAAHPEVEIWNAAESPVPMEEMDGLLLTGGPDVAPEFLRQEIPDPSPIDEDVDPVR
ncbi:MAG: gamma-glutamyl-gamma-aminobutyrate hydrolase family protein, partial [Verrucomicrobiota bacterium]|nr:gamma-glutamyl-gamma-aminobutyrate hydrolase family protein [Verrucomicrobiota bacterium]